MSADVKVSAPQCPNGETVPTGRSRDAVLTVVLRSSESKQVLSVTGTLTHHSIAALEAQIDQIGCAEPTASSSTCPACSESTRPAQT